MNKRNKQVIILQKTASQKPNIKTATERIKLI